MPNVGKLLKDEIARIARKESKAAVSPLRTYSATTRKTLADLKNRVAVLEKETQKLTALLSKAPTLQPDAVESEKGGRVRITVKGIKSLRRKLGLSQSDFAMLLGVSGQAIYLWERKSGALRLRQATRNRLLAARGFGAKEARQRLAEMTQAKSAKPSAIKRGKRK